MAYPFPPVASVSPSSKLSSNERTPSRNMPGRLVKPHAGMKVWITAVAAMTFFSLMSLLFKSTKESDNIPLSRHDVEDYFSHFEGHQDCGITSRQLYLSPNLDHPSIPKYSHFCSNRARLLDAMSGGGRHGFDASYFPAGCHYRWYTTEEICMILDRFDAIVFIGDDSLKHIYAALNMLLRENIAMGGLQQWELNDGDRSTCRCDNQLVRPECSKHILTSSEQVEEKDGSSSHRGPYLCNKTPHLFLPLTHSSPETIQDAYTSLLRRFSDSFKPIPTILSLSSLSTDDLSSSKSLVATATDLMDSTISIADSARPNGGANFPFLWIGPNAFIPSSSSHSPTRRSLLSPQQRDKDSSWQYTLDTSTEAHDRGIETLGMWNLTVQQSLLYPPTASSSSFSSSSSAKRQEAEKTDNGRDGEGRGEDSGEGTYGLSVMLVQAMIVVNWLARVDST